MAPAHLHVKLGPGTPGAVHTGRVQGQLPVLNPASHLNSPGLDLPR